MKEHYNRNFYKSSSVLLLKFLKRTLQKINENPSKTLNKFLKILSHCKGTQHSYLSKVAQSYNTNKTLISSAPSKTTGFVRNITTADLYNNLSLLKMC